MNNVYVDVVGETFEDMSLDEMASFQGLGDIEGRKSSTPVVSKKLSCVQWVCVSIGIGITIRLCRPNG